MVRVSVGNSNCQWLRGQAGRKGFFPFPDILSKLSGIPFPMLSDAGGRVGTVYGVYEEDAGVNIRGRFIIDPDGVIQAMEVLTPPVGRKVADSIRQLQPFQHVRDTKGPEACPAGWEPGQPALKRGAVSVSVFSARWYAGPIERLISVHPPIAASATRTAGGHAKRGQMGRCEASSSGVVTGSSVKCGAPSTSSTASISFQSRRRAVSRTSRRPLIR